MLQQERESSLRQQDVLRQVKKEVSYSAPAAEQTNWGSFTFGILFTLTIAAAGTALAYLPGLNRVGPMLTSILLAVIYRNIKGYPEALREGIRFSGHKILRFAIILYGFKLNIDVVLHKGMTLLLYDVLSIILAIGVTMLVARLIGAEKQLSLLLGIGTGVCGAAAIAAVAPILNADDEETAIGAGIVALMGTVFTLTYTFLRGYLPLSAVEYGVWSGVSLHATAHVAAAAAPAGTEALAEGLLAKLGRVFLMLPLSFILASWMRRKGNAGVKQSTPFPWFLVGFMLTSLMGTYLPIPQTVLNAISTMASFLLAAAMVGLGLNVFLANLKKRALRPLTAMFAASLVLSVVSYFTLQF